MTHRHDEPEAKDDVSRDETPTDRPPPRPVRSMNGARRALDFRRKGKAYARCSKCHVEHELPRGGGLLDASGAPIDNEPPLVSIMIGTDLLGFSCSACFHQLVAHMVSVFPDRNGFPLVNHHGALMETPRCSDCGSALAYDSGGRFVLCPTCDADALSDQRDRLTEKG